MANISVAIGLWILALLLQARACPVLGINDNEDCWKANYGKQIVIMLGYINIFNVSTKL